MKKFLIIAALVVLVFGAWLFASPYLALRQIQAGIVNGDEQKITDNVDFPALRRDISRQVTQRMKAQMGEQKSGNPLIALGGALAEKVAEGLINSLVTPSGFIRMMKDKQDNFDRAQYGYRSINRFVVDIPDENGKQLHLILTRRDFTWKLRRIRLPDVSELIAKVPGLSGN